MAAHLDSPIGLGLVAGMTPENKFGGSFGPNEWLVDEMYEQYLRDPNSVGDDWKAFFAGYKEGAPLNGSQVNGSQVNGSTKPGTPPVPKRDQGVSKSAPTQSPPPALTCFQVVPPANVVTGVDLSVVLLMPNCPRELVPQTHKVPSDLIAAV